MAARVVILILFCGLAQPAALTRVLLAPKSSSASGSGGHGSSGRNSRRYTKESKRSLPPKFLSISRIPPTTRTKLKNGPPVVLRGGDNDNRNEPKVKVHYAVPNGKPEFVGWLPRAADPVVACRRALQTFAPKPPGKLVHALEEVKGMVVCHFSLNKDTSNNNNANHVRVFYRITSGAPDFVGWVPRVDDPMVVCRRAMQTIATDKPTGELVHALEEVKGQVMCHFSLNKDTTSKIDPNIPQVQVFYAVPSGTPEFVGWLPRTTDPMIVCQQALQTFPDETPGKLVHALEEVKGQVTCHFSLNKDTTGQNTVTFLAPTWSSPRAYAYTLPPGFGPQMAFSVCNDAAATLLAGVEIVDFGLYTVKGILECHVKFAA